MKARAYIMVTMEVGTLEMRVKLISVHGERVRENNLSDVIFEWFHMTGYSFVDARENAVQSIAFFVKCRPHMTAAIIPKLAPGLREEVEAHLRDHG